jgi:hypothetical protein
MPDPKQQRRPATGVFAIPVVWIDASGMVRMTLDEHGARWWQKIDGEWREYVEEDDARGSTGRAGHDPGDSG